MEALDDRKLKMKFMIAEANMRQRLENDGPGHEPGRQVLQAADDLGGEIVHVPPLGWDSHNNRVNVLLSA